MNTKDRVKERFIQKDSSLIDALKKMDRNDCKLLIVMSDDEFNGLLSIGDIQRAIINNEPLENSISNILRDNIKIAHESDSFDEVKEMMAKYRMELCPVINEAKEIESVYFWEDLFKDQKVSVGKSFNTPVVVMAGGFGTRMKPLTNVLPKPLIPIGDKTILQEIYDRFNQYGCTNFFTSVNYKGKFIENYINELELPYSVNFFTEDKPLGTAGSLQLLKREIDSTFFVHNCDILIKNDYSEILDYHRANKNEITVIAALQHLKLAYGTLETGKNGELLSLSEKPDLTFKVNTGMYILEPHLLNEIPENEFYHITDLIEAIKKRNGKVGVFPVSEKSWVDIGNWDAYLEFVKK